MPASAIATIDSVFRLVERSVWIVTAQAGERRGGLVATWVSQASIDAEHPVAAAAIAVNHHTRELIDASGAFALHLIDASQIEHAWRFGLGSGRDRDKLAGVAHHTEITGSPVLDDCLAWLDCRVFHRHDGGDRIYYWADCLAAGKPISGEPLTDRGLIARATPEQKHRLLAELAADVDVQRPLLEAWRLAESRRAH